MTLYLVPVPVGNLDDITLRAVKILKDVDFIIAEDTRYSLKLLNHLDIRKRMVSYYRPKEHEKAGRIADEIEKGATAALITDCGSPCISDPGYVLVNEVVSRGIDIVALPGPTAFVPALSASGIVTDRFLFAGFPPRKKGELIKFFEKLENETATMIFYESPKRVEAFLRVAAEVFGERKFVLAKELSKKNEKYIRGNLCSIDEVLENEVLLGEFVVILEGTVESSREEVPELSSIDDIYAYFMKKYGISKNTIKQIFMTRNSK